MLNLKSVDQKWSTDVNHDVQDVEAKVPHCFQIQPNLTKLTGKKALFYEQEKAYTS